MVAPGARLGPYEILAKIGEGGMGEVYRARDTRLDRLVAVKVLPTAFSQDAERRARFEREARAIASLTHPHICTLHDVGREQDVDYLVMELIEGQTLADRLRGGRLALAETLACAVQIADAVATAHRLGIVHRDLKPGNIMLVRPASGAPPRPHVKLLDFGLARLGLESVASDAATVAAPLTGAGAIVGTLNYMAPEQLQGVPYDARVDIFAFGAILFEMLTGRRAFEGSSHPTVAGAVLHTDPPPVTAVVPGVPPALERVVATCLAKHPDNRWSTMHDVLLQLRDMSVGDPTMPARAESPPRGRRDWLPWSVAALSAVIAAASWIGARATSDEAAAVPARPDVLSVLPPPGATPSYAWEAPQVSHDGRHIAFAASDQSGTVWLYVRSREAIEPRRLAGTEEASQPFWSPDSTRLGFFAAGQLKTVALDGSAARTLAAAPVPRGGTWGRDDVILYSAVPNTPPMLVPAAGGESKPVPVERVERGFRSFPQLLPDGRHYLFEALEGISGGPAGVRVASLDSTDVREVVKTRGNAFFVDGQLLFLRDSTLVAQSFDLESLQIRGTPVVIAEGVGFNAITYQGLFSVSRDAIAYLAGTRGAQLEWFDRQGRSLGAATPPGDFSTLCLTADERTVVFEQADSRTGAVDLWTLDVGTKQTTRLTFDPSVDFYPVCGPAGPAGREVLFASLRAGPPSLFRLPFDTPGSEKPALVSFAAKIPSDWIDGGRQVVLSILNPQNSWDIAVWRMGDAEPRPVVATSNDERAGRVSPDGRWLAYTAREGNGRFEVYVQPFPGGGGKWQVSSNGGMQPAWGKGGSELYYLMPDRRLVAVPVRSGPRDVAFGPAEVLMASRAAGREGGNAISTQYDVTGDGQRFLISTAADPAPISVMLNWKAAARR